MIEGLTPSEPGDPADDRLPEPEAVPSRYQPGDLWQLGPHHLICGDALDPAAYKQAPHPRGRIIVIAPTRAACETIELALGYSEANTSPLLKFLLTKVDELKFRVSKALR